jgi:hypothetical protein
MPALRCPDCGYSDLHAVDVELIQPDSNAKSGMRRSHQQELGCKRCGWSPSKAAVPELVLASRPLDRNS